MKDEVEEMEEGVEGGAVTTAHLRTPTKALPASCEPKDGEVVVGDGYDSPELIVDLHDGRILLRKAATLLSYLGDQGISGKIGKKERASMRKLAGMIAPFLDETGVQWEFDDTIEEGEV